MTIKNFVFIMHGDHPHRIGTELFNQFCQGKILLPHYRDQRLYIADVMMQTDNRTAKVRQITGIVCHVNSAGTINKNYHNPNETLPVKAYTQTHGNVIFAAHVFAQHNHQHLWQPSTEQHDAIIRAALLEHHSAPQVSKSNT